MIFSNWKEILFTDQNYNSLILRNTYECCENKRKIFKAILYRVRIKHNLEIYYTNIKRIKILLHSKIEPINAKFEGHKYFNIPWAKKKKIV